MIKWQKRLAKTSANYPTKGSFYTQYIILLDSTNSDIQTYYGCEYVYTDNEYKLQVVTSKTQFIYDVGYETIEARKIIAEFPHDAKYMKEAKSIIENLINQ